jgi:hypothetical protein
VWTKKSNRAAHLTLDSPALIQDILDPLGEEDGSDMTRVQLMGALMRSTLTPEDSNHRNATLATP